jgi:hypothetical protein
MTKDELIVKIKSGDYITLGSILGCDSNAARMRFKRNNPEALEGMEKIIIARESLIEKNNPKG